jgi:hypothetical protein
VAAGALSAEQIALEPSEVIVANLYQIAASEPPAAVGAGERLGLAPPVAVPSQDNRLGIEALILLVAQHPLCDGKDLLDRTVQKRLAAYPPVHRQQRRCLVRNVETRPNGAGRGSLYTSVAQGLPPWAGLWGVAAPAGPSLS